MTDAREFQNGQLPKQEEAIFQAIAVASNTPNPVIEVPFFLYPETLEYLETAGWTVLGEYRCVYNGKVAMYTHLCPMSMVKNKKKGDNAENKSQIVCGIID